MVHGPSDLNIYFIYCLMYFLFNSPYPQSFSHHKSSLYRYTFSYIKTHNNNLLQARPNIYQS